MSIKKEHIDPYLLWSGVVKMKRENEKLRRKLETLESLVLSLQKRLDKIEGVENEEQV